MSLDLNKYCAQVPRVQHIRIYGRITDVVGLTIEATGPSMSIGDLCYVLGNGSGHAANGSNHSDAASFVRNHNGFHRGVPVEVVGFRQQRLLLMPLGRMEGIGPGSLLVPTFLPTRVRVGRDLLGRVLDSLGRPIDGKGAPETCMEMPLVAVPPRPLERRRITEPVATGIRSIDACLTCGKGQRVGIMSGSGVGKSKLLGMIARNTSADVSVIALIGERGREVRDFIEVDLREEGLRRSVVIVATSDEPALLRIKGAYLATAIAEWFRDQGADVMLLMDSLTRFAMAQREIGLAVGEPPTTKGYPPSVYALLPRLLERAGTSPAGSITGIYSVLVEADDLNDPVGDASRSILDGHIALSRDLAARGHYPAVDILQSISRSMIDVVPEEHVQLAQRVRHTLATYRDAADLINIGAYVKGSNAEIDRAIRVMPNLLAFLQQGLVEKTAFDDIPRLMQQALTVT